MNFINEINSLLISYFCFVYYFVELKNNNSICFREMKKSLYKIYETIEIAKK